MVISITNRTKQLIIMELNNGESIYLGPDRPSAPIDEAQIEGNEKYEKLLRTNVITSAEAEVEKKKKTKADKDSEK